MKKFYLLILSFISFSFLFTSTLDAITLASGTKEHLELRGHLSSIQGAKSASDPVQAFLEEQTLEIYFRANVGTVVVFVEGNNEMLYQRNVDTAANRQVLINLSSFESGEYTLKIANDKGESLTGEFIK